MNRNDLIKKVMAAGLGKTQATVAVEAALNALKDAFAAKEEVIISNFGKFTPVKVAARNRYDMSKGEITKTPATWKVRFTLSNSIKSNINRK